MTEMSDLGFLKGVIVETIVSTYDMNGQPNAAPMGVRMKDTKRLVIRPYTSSSTYKNLQEKRFAVINVTSDPELYYLTAFKEALPGGKMPLELFEKAERVDAPRLRLVGALVEVSVAHINLFNAERAEVLCTIKLVKASKALPKVYCRAMFATIEAIIHATHINHLLIGDKQDQKQLVNLLELVRNCHDVVNRTASNSRYSEIMTDLTQRINSWRNKK